MRLSIGRAFLAASIVFAANLASATAILSPVAVIENTMGEFAGSPPTVTIDQSGLSAGFISGVTDFDAYLAGDPRHTTTFPGFEWFSNPSGITAGSLGYDLGASYTIDRIALWNEEFSGIGVLDVFVADNPGFVGATLVGTFFPTNHPQFPIITDYPADVFAFTPLVGRYVRLAMSSCPQPEALYDGCSLGEVAFSVDAVTAVPEPGAALLLVLGGVAVGVVARRRRS